MNETAQLRIGELARRTGVATELLRAWERRYGLLAPVRTASGYRLYSADDVLRVGRMRQLLAAGLSAAEAAGQALAEPPRGSRRARHPRPPRPSSAARSRRSTMRPRTPPSTVSSPTTRPRPCSAGSSCRCCTSLGAGWEQGEISVAQEHFASNLLRGRLLGLARGWDRGSGPRAVLACPPGERHDLGLVIFGLALRELGWRITFLGADTPPDTLVDTVRRLAPDALVLAVADPARLEGVAETVAELAGGATTVWVGGAGAEPLPGAQLLEGSPLEAAAQVAA